jgi:beta-lactamase regulating signal transducer with metallopeptidase domain
MHDTIARMMYHFSIHLLFASVVGLAAWLLTSFLRASASTKYWIWVVTALNFILPSGALIDKLLARHLTWARPLGAIGDEVWHGTQGWTAVVLGMIWLAGALSMLVRLLLRLQRERCERLAAADRGIHCGTSDFLADGIPVSFHDGHPGPTVRGVLSPHILLPLGINRLLTPRELDAVLMHEVAHVKRADNLIRLFYEMGLCALWFHPLVWLAGARIGLYRELSCDESVIRHAHGPALVSALAKLAIPRQAGFLEATLSSHLSYRLERLAGPAETRCRPASLLLTSLFSAVVAGGIFQTVAHTACCFIHKH